MHESVVILKCQFRYKPPLRAGHDGSLGLEGGSTMYSGTVGLRDDCKRIGFLRSMRRHPRLVSFLLVLLMATAGTPFVASATSHTAAQDPSITLSIMTFNIFYGGDEINLDTYKWPQRPAGCPETLDQIVEAIRASCADIVGIQEGTMNTRPIADKLGWYSSERMQIVSRYPLIDPPSGDGLYIFVEPLPGRVAALTNVHLPSDPYSPYEIRDGATLGEVIELEETLRLPAIQEVLQLPPLLASEGIPVFLTGDFNSPSYLDWTEEVVVVRDVVRYPVEWPVSVALADVGFRDSYREARPDPVANPGFTWTRPGSPESVRDEVYDRIDWVLAAGPLTTLNSQLVGESDYSDVDIAVDPWPSDHRSVVSTFQVTPAEMPVLVAVDRRGLEVGDTLGVRFHAPGRSGERVAIVPSGGSPTSAVASQPTGGVVDGTLSFVTASLSPGAYEAVLVAKNGQALARIPFWLYEQGAPTTVTTSKLVYERSEPIVVSWTNAPGMKWDWLAVYKPGNGDESPISTTRVAGYGSNMHYLFYQYTQASIEGTAVFSDALTPYYYGYSTWPLQPGNYEIRLLSDDGYTSLASSASFKVVQG